MQFDILPFLEKYFDKDEYIILGCSTGPDSMFLLYEILKTPYKKNLVACYFNHKLRKEADDEEEFLKDLGEKEGFKVESGKNIRRLTQNTADVSENDLNNEISEDKWEGSLEGRARIARYEFFEKVLQKYKTNKIILAHHLDDKIETFFFNLVRGTKLTGLINMTNPNFPLDKVEQNGISKKGLIVILRPLLNIEKKDIQKYLDENKLKYFVDNSNFDTNITRNKLRLEVLPKFEEINGNYKENISNLMKYFGEVKENIDEEVKKFLSLPISYNLLFPTSRLKNSKIKKKVFVISENEEKQNSPQSPFIKGENLYSPLIKGGREISGKFEISAFNFLSPFMQKEVIRYIYFISNGNSTIGLSEANIGEIIKFINGKNNKTVKEIGGLKMRKENKIILY